MTKYYVIFIYTYDYFDIFFRNYTVIPLKTMH